MAVEFRSRSWYSLKPPRSVLINLKKEEEKGKVGDGRPPLFKTQLEATLAALTQLNIINIASDDLGCEFGASEPPQPMMQDGRLLVADYITSPKMAIIRLHRRKGDKRILGSAVLRELSCRVHRLAASAGGEEAYECPLFRELQSERRFTDDLVKKSFSTLSIHQTITKLAGPIYFLCGTDYEDQPIINMRALTNSVESFKRAAEGSSLSLSSSASSFLPLLATVFDWTSYAKKSSAKTGILKFFSPAVPAKPAPAPAAPIAGKKREREEDKG